MEKTKMLFYINMLSLSVILYSAEEVQITCKLRIEDYHIATLAQKNCLVYSLTVPEHIIFLRCLESRSLASINDNDINFVLSLLMQKFVATNGSDNIESFLKNKELLSENLENKLKKLLYKKHGYEGDLKRLDYRQLVPTQYFSKNTIIIERGSPYLFFGGLSFIFIVSLQYFFE